MAARPEVRNRQIKEITAPENLEIPELEQDGRQEHGDDPETDRAPDSPLQNSTTVVAGEMPDHHGQHQSVVGAQKPFQEHQHSDVPGDQGKVSGQVDQHEALTSGSRLDASLGSCIGHIARPRNGKTGSETKEISLPQPRGRGDSPPGSPTAMTSDSAATSTVTRSEGRSVRRLALVMGPGAGLAVVLTLDGPGLTIDEPLDVRPGRTYIEIIREEGLRFLIRKVVDRVFRDNAEHPPLGRWLLGIASTLGEPFEVIWKGPDPTGQYVLAGRLAPAVSFAVLVGVVTLVAGRRWGFAAGVAAGFALVAMPRVFAHAHLAALDTFLSLFWTLALVAGERVDLVRRVSFRAMAVAGALWSLALLDQDPRLVPVADSRRLGVLRFPPRPATGRDGDLGARRDQPVLARLAVALVRLLRPHASLLGYGRGPANPHGAIFRPGVRGSERALALPLVLFRSDCAAWIAASRRPWARSRLEESPCTTRFLCCWPATIAAFLVLFSTQRAGLRRRAAFLARFPGMVALDRSGFQHALEPFSNRCLFGPDSGSFWLAFCWSRATEPSSCTRSA